MMNNSFKTFFLVVGILVSYGSKAQQFYLETGFSDAVLKDYKNSVGENTLDLSYSKPSESFMEGGLKFKVYKEIIKWNTGVNFSNYQINSAFSIGGGESSPVSFELSYISLETGVTVSVIDWRKMKLHLHSNISHDWLTFGITRYSDVVVDAYKENTFSHTLLSYHTGISFEYGFTKNVSAYLKYNRANSFQQKDENIVNPETYSLETKSISIGIIFNIQKVKNNKLK